MFTIDYCKNAKMKKTTKMTNLNLNMYITVGYMINKVFKFLPNIFLSFYILSQVRLQVLKKWKVASMRWGWVLAQYFSRVWSREGYLRILRVSFACIFLGWHLAKVWKNFGYLSHIGKKQCWVVLSFQRSIDLGF
jgi:hypothetical protein